MPYSVLFLGQGAGGNELNMIVSEAGSCPSVVMIISKRISGDQKTKQLLR